jgi:hypothetical protein
MATFGTPKALDEIQEIEPLEEDWYKCQVVEEPELAENKKMRDDPSQDGAGHNLVIKLRTVTDDEHTTGRAMTIWMSWPSEADKEKTTAIGQTYEDFKLDQICAVAAALMGIPKNELSGDEITIDPGMEAYFYVTKEARQDGEGFFNSIDTRMTPRIVE